jgi:hypothetical protein
MTLRDDIAVDASAFATTVTSTHDEGYRTDSCNSNSNSNSRWSGYLTKNQGTPKATKYRPSIKSSPYARHPYQIPGDRRHNPIHEEKQDSRDQRQLLFSASSREMQNPNPTSQDKLAHVAQSSFRSLQHQPYLESDQNQSSALSKIFPDDPFFKVAPISVRDYDEVVRKHSKVITTNQRENASSLFGIENTSSSKLKNLMETSNSPLSNLNSTSVYFGGSEKTKPTPRKIARLSNLSRLYPADPMTSRGNILLTNSSFYESFLFY